MALKHLLQSDDFNSILTSILITFGGLFWLLTLQPVPGFFTVIHYLFLIATIVGVVRLCADKWKAYRKWIKIGGTVIGIYLVILYSQHDYYMRNWTDDNDGTSYHDTYKRSNNKLVERWVFFKDGGSAHGPMAGEGEPRHHGHWVIYSFKEGSMDVFYWYGEKISEGEWHLRNKN